jgi:type I restriction enzyme M protein
VKMRKSLGNKRNKIGRSAMITRIFGSFQDGETRTLAVNGGEKTVVVGKIFDNADFGFHKITVERPLRLNFQASTERIQRLENETAFKNLADSKKKNEAVHLREIEAGRKRQEEIRALLRAFAEAHGEMLHKDRKGVSSRSPGNRPQARRASLCRRTQGRAQRPGRAG